MQMELEDVGTGTSWLGDAQGGWGLEEGANAPGRGVVGEEGGDNGCTGQSPALMSTRRNCALKMRTLSH
jgi:hypothetical protein